MKVPAASAAIVAENAVMIAAIASAMGVQVTLANVTSALGVAGSLNVFGRAIFVEVARWMGWAAGPLGIAGVSALGAATAGLQTWVLGKLAIALCENGGRPLPASELARVLDEAKASYEEVREQHARGARK